MFKSEDCSKWNWYIAKKLREKAKLLCREVIVFAYKMILSPGVEKIIVRKFLQGDILSIDVMWNLDSDKISLLNSHRD